MKIHKTLKNPKSYQRLYLPKKTVERFDAPSAHRGTTDLSVPVYELRDAREISNDRARGELFSRARMQWQFGDWASLEKLDLLHIEHHPERAELALLAGCAALQAGNQDRGRACLSSALEWGCDSYLIFRLLISGVYNSLGRYHALSGNEELGQKFFQFAGTGLGGDPELIGEVRRQKELLALPGINLEKPTGRLLAGNTPEKDAATVQMAGTDESSLANPVARAEGAVSPFRSGIRSYAQNFEDVMLWRALGQVENGFYIDIGAQHPLEDSVSKAFYEKGWRGVHVEPTHAYATLLRQDRPDETVIEAAVSDAHGYITFYQLPESGLSTGDASIAAIHRENGYQIDETRRGSAVNEITVPAITLADIFALSGDREIHWLKIDVEGMEKDVLQSWGAAPQRPWVVVVESTVPNSRIETHDLWEHHLKNRDYLFVLFDGLSRFYLSRQHEELRNEFTTPPNVFDGFAIG